MICKSCDNEFEGNFCPRCGQKADSGRITFSSVVNHVVVGLTTMDRGLLYNLKNLTFHPQKTIIGYINGRRRFIFNPISYAILSISIYMILDQMIDVSTPGYVKTNDPQYPGTYEIGVATGKFIRNDLKYFWLFNIVLLSLFTRMFFQRFNYFEHLTINAFIIGHTTVVGILCLILFKWHIVFNPLLLLSLILMVMLTSYRKGELIQTVVLSILSILLTYILFLAIPYLIIYLSKTIG